MPKVKYTDGMLCRDTDESSQIAFAPEAVRKDVVLVEFSHRGGHIWCTHENYPGGFNWKIWSPELWKATYDLAPPRKGRCFECEVEL